MGVFDRGGTGWAWLLVACGCGSTEPPPGPPPTRLQQQEIATSVDGLSGLTTDGDGVRWSIAERERALVTIPAEGPPRRVPLRGVPDGLDTESIAWVEGARFAVGTESMDEDRTSDLVLVVELGADEARVVGRLEVPYAMLGIEAEENRGVEGIAFVPGVSTNEWPGTLIVAMENVVERGGRRYAPLGVYADGRWRRALVALSTDTGKIAALDARAVDGGIEVRAIERHYGVMRVLGFTLGPSAETITPTLVVDLAGRVRGDANLEGLTRVGDELWLIADNHHGRRTGPNLLVRVVP